MMAHQFLKNGIISPEDLKKIIELTEKGILVWFCDPTNAGSFVAVPAGIDAQHQDVCEQAIGRNLRGVEIAWDLAWYSRKAVWYYILLKDDKKSALVIRRKEATSQERILVDQLFEMIRTVSSKK